MAGKRTTASDPVADLVIATETYITEVDGAPTSVTKGQILRKGDPRLRGGAFRKATEDDLMETTDSKMHRPVTW